MDKTMFMIGPVMVPDKVDDKLEYDIIDGYEFDRVENGKIILKPIKPKYPTNYKECRAILDDYNTGNVSGYKASLLASLQDLLVCRNAYWKIAGEEMGLDKPWEPDWNEANDCIINWNSEIKCEPIVFKNVILAFPNEEMRDAFYKNFKDLIEKCKELL